MKSAIERTSHVAGQRKVARTSLGDGNGGKRIGCGAILQDNLLGLNGGLPGYRGQYELNEKPFRSCAARIDVQRHGQLSGRLPAGNDMT
ncbi:MAG: hypothetical protein HC883_02595 [Bdellovibrionaceae bacterium]|nr:hypothetical protein [Pseudobdellovibrionaceae bacterium]